MHEIANAENDLELVDSIIHIIGSISKSNHWMKVRWAIFRLKSKNYFYTQRRGKMLFRK